MAKGFTNVNNVRQSDIHKIDLTLDDMKALIGQVGNTGGTSTAGTIMAKLNKLLTDWTTTRAGKIDTIHTNASNLNTRLTSTRAGYLDKLANLGAANDTGGTSTTGTAMAKMNKLLTDFTTTRAGYLDKLANLGATGDTGGSATAGTMMAKLNKLLTDWTGTRAGYINTINTNAARLTSTRAGYIDKLANLGATGDTGGSATAGTIMAKLNKLLTDYTSTRAGYLDKLGKGYFIKSLQWGYVSLEPSDSITRDLEIAPVNAGTSLLYADPTLETNYKTSCLYEWKVRLYDTKITQWGDLTPVDSLYNYYFLGFRYVIIEFSKG